MKNTKKSLFLSGASLVLSAALLAGSTFAWFTDSVTNTGNQVQAGTLSIDAVAYDLAKSGENGFTIEGVNGGETFYFEEKGQDLKTEKDPIISEENWEPGVSSAKLLQLTYSGTLATKIKVDFTVLENDLTNALWFDFVQVDENGQISGKFTRRPMSTLETFADNLELPLSADKSVQFILVYGMNEEAGNEYQGKSFAADVSILAAQYTEETDGFDSNQYDKDAAYDTVVSGKDDLSTVFANAQDEERIIFNENVSSENNVDIRNRENVVVDFNQNTAEIDNNNIAMRVIGSAEKKASATFADGTIKAGQGTYCTVGASNADLTLNNMSLYNETAWGNSVKSFAGGVITLNNVTSTSVNGGAMEAAGGTINVNGGTFTQTGKYDWNSCFGAVSSGTGTLNVRDMQATGDSYGFYIFSSGGTINIYSGTFTAGTVLKADLDLGTYPTAQGIINIYGGSFDGKIAVNDKCTMNVEAGTFANTGLTLEQFQKYVAEGSSVSENNGTFAVVKN